MRNGVGTCSWADGSQYEGDWKDNLRHGNGKMVQNNETYLGQWQQDLKHGRGQMTLADGNVIKGTWMFDKLNGLACIQSKGKGKKEYAIYKEGMQINLTKDINTGTYCYVIFSILFMLTFYAAIPVAILLDDPVYFSIMGVALVYLIMSCCTDTCKYIRNLVELPQVFQNIANAIRNAPTKTFHISCYHWETRTVTERDNDGNTRTKTEQHKVYTHHASQNFYCGHFVDQSPPPSVLHYLDMLKLARLHTTKIIHFTSVAHARYSMEKHDFIRRNDRDVHYDFSEKQDIPGHKGHCLVYNPKEGSKPWFTDMCLLVLLDLLMLGWIQRWKLDTKTFKVEYTLKKLVLS